MARAVKNIVDDIKNKIRTEGTTSDEIVSLFEEAYRSLPENDNLRTNALSQLESIMKNVLKSNKELFSKEDRETLYTMRDTKGASVERKDAEAESDSSVVVNPTDNREKDFDLSVDGETPKEANTEIPDVGLSDIVEAVKENAERRESKPFTEMTGDEILQDFERVVEDKGNAQSDAKDKEEDKGEEVIVASNKEQIEMVNKKIKEIREKAQQKDATADEIIVLFSEAYASLPSNLASSKSALERIDKEMRNVAKNRKDIFDEEKVTELRALSSGAKRGYREKRVAEEDARVNSEAEVIVEAQIQPQPQTQTQTVDDVVVSTEDNEPKLSLRSFYENEGYYSVEDGVFIYYKDILKEDDFQKAEEFLATKPDLFLIVSMRYAEGEEHERYVAQYGDNYKKIADMVSSYMYRVNEEREKEEQESEIKIEEAESDVVTREDLEKFAGEWRVEASDSVIDSAVKAYNKAGGDIVILSKMHRLTQNEDIRQSYKLAMEYGKYKQAMSEGEIYVYDVMGIDSDSKVVIDNKDVVYEGDFEVSENELPTKGDAINECRQYLSDEDSKSLSFIENKESKDNIQKLLDSDDKSIALGNMDHLLLAHHYFGEKEKYRDDIDKLIEEQLRALISDKGHNISPNNIQSIIALADRCNNSELRYEVLRYAMAVMDKYNKAYIGDLGLDEAQESYEELSERANKFNPFEKPEKEGELDLGTCVEYQDDNSKPLSEAGVKGAQEDISMVARELAVQSLTKFGSGNVTDEKLQETIRHFTQKILHGANVNTDRNNPNIIVTNSSLAASLAREYVEAGKFKNIIKFKFKNSRFARGVDEKLKNMDKKLHDKYGEPYDKAKGVLKFIGNVAVNSAKTALLYGAASFIPGGIPVLMAYNAVKSWRETAKVLKNKEADKADKIGAVINSTVTTALSAIGVSSGFQFTKELGAAMTGGLQYGRMGIVAAASSSNNFMKNIANRWKRHKIDKKLKGMDPESDEAKRLMVERDAISSDISKNRKEAGKKFVATAAGMFVAQCVSGAINDIRNGGEQQVENNLADVVNDESGSEVLGSENQNADVYTNGDEASSLVSDENAGLENDGLENDDANIVAQESDSLENDDANIVAQESDSLENDESLSELEALKAQNLEASYAEGSSGLGTNESSYEHTVRHLYNLNDARINGTDGFGYEGMAENLCENFGQDANKVAIACKMAPYALQDALGLDLPNGENPTTYQMLNYMAEHPLTEAQLESLNGFLEENFDGANFRSENFGSYNQSSMNANSVVDGNSGLDGAQSVNTDGNARTGVNIDVNVNAPEGSKVSVGVDLGEGEVTPQPQSEVDGNSVLDGEQSVNTDGNSGTGVDVNVSATEGSDVNVEVNLGGGVEEPQPQSEVEKFFNEELATEDHRRSFVEKNEDGSVNARYTFVPGNEEIDGAREITETTTKFKGDSKMVITHEYNDGSRMRIVVPDAGPAFRDDIISVTENSEGISETRFRDGRTMILNNEDGTRFITDKDGNISYQGPTNDSDDQVRQNAEISLSNNQPVAENVQNSGEQNIRINVTVDTPEVEPASIPVQQHAEVSLSNNQPVAEEVQNSGEQNIRINVTVDTPEVEPASTPVQQYAEYHQPYPEQVVVSGYYSESTVFTSAEQYAAVNGLVYDHKLSIGIDRYGDGLNFDGYNGVYYYANDPQRVVVLPNDMIGDFDDIRQSTRFECEAMRGDKREVYYQQPHRNNYAYCHRGEVGYYSSSSVDGFYGACYKANQVISTIDNTVHTVGCIADEVSHIADMFRGGRGGRW